MFYDYENSGFIGTEKLNRAIKKSKNDYIITYYNTRRNTKKMYYQFNE
jgi:hypothetical protein